MVVVIVTVVMIIAVVVVVVMVVVVAMVVVVLVVIVVIIAVLVDEIFCILSLPGTSSIIMVEQCVYFLSFLFSSLLYRSQKYSTEHKIPTEYVPIYFIFQ